MQSWLPAARVWWTCPSGAEETETAGRPKERERGERGERPHLTAQSLETSKSQTLGGIAGGNRWVWVILPGEGASQHQDFQRSLTDKSVCGNRKSPLYDNCFLHAPDGQPLCTCDKKKAKWYLDKGIGGTQTTPSAETLKYALITVNTVKMAVCVCTVTERL